MDYIVYQSYTYYFVSETNINKFLKLVVFASANKKVQTLLNQRLVEFELCLMC